MRRIDKGEVQRRSEEEKEEEGRRGGGGDVWPAKPKIFIIWPFTEVICRPVFWDSGFQTLAYIRKHLEGLLKLTAKPISRV